jgi:hypothetical protein
MLAAIALVIFVLAAFKVRIESVNLVDLGLAFLAAALLFGNWPMGIWTRRD